MSTMQMDAVTRNGFLLVHGSGTCDAVCRRMQRLAPAGGATFDSTRDRSWVRQPLSQDESECFGELDGPGFDFQRPMCHVPCPSRCSASWRAGGGRAMPCLLACWATAGTSTVFARSDPSAEPRHQAPARRLVATRRPWPQPPQPPQPCAPNPSQSGERRAAWPMGKIG
jgi:hypothetical protein